MDTYGHENRLPAEGEGAGTKSTDGAQPQYPPKPSTMSRDEMDLLYQNCIKLASENKISQKNTWSLRLIDHLSDLVKPSVEENAPPNFSRAGCTLDASTKIYAYRVDSVHDETFKVLGFMNRSGPRQPEELAREGEDYNLEATLESSFDAITNKQLDEDVAVDPLFHKTSAQFDASGASGLLLNNLSVYNGCEIVFDSAEVPQSAQDRGLEPCPDVQIDLGLLPPHVLSLARNPPATSSIAPALDEILRLLGNPPPDNAASEAARLVSEVLTGNQGARQPEDSACQMDEGVYENDGGGDGGFDYDDMNRDDDGGGGGASFDYHDENADDVRQSASEDLGKAPAFGSFAAAAVKDESGTGIGVETLQWLTTAGNIECDQGGDLTPARGPVTRGTSWAGAGHWRFRAEPPTPKERAATKPKTPSRKKKVTAEVDYEIGREEDFSTAMGRSKGPQLVKVSTKDTELPNDMHYKADILERVRTKPLAHMHMTRSATAAAAGRVVPTPMYNDNNNDNDNDSDDHDGGFDGWCGYGGGDNGDDGSTWPALEQSSGMIDEPPRVVQQSISYALSAPQVDVKALKHALWTSIKNARELQGGSAEPLPFAHLIAEVTGTARPGADGMKENCLQSVLGPVSMHLCFICLLHLANEHSLLLSDSPDFTTLTVQLPA